MKFKDKWLEIAQEKNSLLCVGLDPAEHDQRKNAPLKKGENKIDWCLNIIEKVAPFASAIKPNRKYFQDCSRSQMQTLTAAIHHHNMLAIDDNKITDIGSTLDSALYHTQKENFDAVTFAPFAGNTLEANDLAKKHNIALITLTLMSNPEFQKTKLANYNGMHGFEYFAKEAKACDFVEGLVIGAPSKDNHISGNDLKTLKPYAENKIILMPGIGTQGGSAKDVINIFGDHLMINVGRAIIESKNPTEAAKTFRNEFNSYR